jgi:tetratricopeptide (TPR) repeat protein
VGLDQATGRLRGETEALSVLRNRPRRERPDLRPPVMTLLAHYVDHEKWESAGLPAFPPGLSTRTPSRSASQEAVIRLARLAVHMHCAELKLADHATVWTNLEAYFAQVLPASDPALVRLREIACNEQVNTGQVPPGIIEDLTAILDFHREHTGDDSYLTGLSRANVSVAYLRSGDLARSTTLISAEAQARADRYGPDHPVTLVARSLLARSLLLQAEATQDQAERLRLARHALSLITGVRASRDRMYGIAAPNATRSRRYEAHALLLLGELDRARSCLEHALAFDRTRAARTDTHSIGQTHLLLARVHAARGHREGVIEHAGHAQRILSRHRPDGAEARAAADLLRQSRVPDDG